MELDEKELNEMKIDGEDFSEEFFAEHDDNYVNDEEDENDE